MSVTSSITVKSVFADDIRRFVVSRETTFEDFAKLLRQMYGLEGPITVRYVDDEDEMITVTTDVGLREAFSLVVAGAVKTLKFHVQGEQKPPEAKRAAPSQAQPQEQPVVFHSAAPVAAPNPTPVPTPSPTPAAAAAAGGSGFRGPHKELVGMLRGLMTDPNVAPILPQAVQVALVALSNPAVSVPQAIERMFASYPVLQSHPTAQILMQHLLANAPQVEALRQSVPPQTLMFASMMVPQLLQNPMVLQMLESGNYQDLWGAAAGGAGGNPWGAQGGNPWGGPGANPWGGGNSQPWGGGSNPWGGANDRKTPATGDEDDMSDEKESEDDEEDEEPTSSVPADAHRGVTCDGCGQSPICGLRYKCSLCDNYDLCAACEAKDVHPAEHPLIKMRAPASGVPPPNEPARPHGVPASVMPQGYMPQNFMPTGYMPTGFMPNLGNILGGGRGGRGGGRRGGMRKPRAKMVKECTLPDITEVGPSQTLVKTWQMQNTGKIAWPTGTKLLYLRGDLPSLENSFDVTAPEPNGLVEVSAVVRTPQSSGRYRAVFRLADGTGKKFGPRLVCVLIVRAESNPWSVPSVPVPVTQPQPSAPILPSGKYAAQLEALKSMGYDNNETMTYLLDIHNGNVEAVINFLLEQK